MFLWIGITIALAVAVVLIYAATKPDTLRISRSTVIRASPEAIFALIKDFHSWPKWAPQDREEPTMVRSYSGVGAVSDREGTGRVGNGRMSITE